MTERRHQCEELQGEGGREGYAKWHQEVLEEVSNFFCWEEEEEEEEREGVIEEEEKIFYPASRKRKVVGISPIGVIARLLLLGVVFSAAPSLSLSGT